MQKTLQAVHPRRLRERAPGPISSNFTPCLNSEHVMGSISNSWSGWVDNVASNEEKAV